MGEGWRAAERGVEVGIGGWAEEEAGQGWARGEEGWAGWGCWGGCRGEVVEGGEGDKERWRRNHIG